MPIIISAHTGIEYRVWCMKYLITVYSYKCTLYVNMKVNDMMYLR